MYPEISHCTYVLPLAFSLNIKFLISIPNDLYRHRALSFISLSKVPSLFAKYMGTAQPLFTLNLLKNTFTITDK